MSCSATEIAEKKRIALEKLRAKKAQLAESGGCSKPTIPVAKLAIAPKPPTTGIKSSAASFLNSLKQSSNALMQRLEAREAAHPYHRPTKPLQKSAEPERSGALVDSSAKKQLASVFVNSVTAKVYLVSNTRFAVNASSYHTQLIQIFKSIPSKDYDAGTRIWTFALQDYELLQQRVAPMKPDVVIGNIPKNIMSLVLAPSKEYDRSCLASIEPALADTLMPFQQDGVCFAIAQHGRIMICDEMGLGKTYQALAVADFYKENWPLLICTTASTRDAWKSHILKLIPSVPLHYIEVMTNGQQYIGDAKVLITSYTMMEKHTSRLEERKFGCLIFDESHNLKSHKAKCTVVAHRLASNAKRVILLSGTPALSRPLELFTQLRMCDRNFISYMDFTARYCDGKQTHFGWEANGQSNLEELNVVLRLKYMIRRTKADVLPQMAEKFREIVVLDPALVWPNDECKESLDTYAKNYSASKGKEKEKILLNFYAETAKVKTRAVCSYLKTLIENKKKFIVFAHHRIMMDAITECLIKLKVNYIRIDGSTRNETRTEYINTFQKKSSCMVAALSLKACNSGITLTAAELIVFAEIDWNPSTLAQAESRAHRIGQEKPVTCLYLLATKTADDVIWNMVKSKQGVLNRIGIFCENLQEATHTAAPTISHKIDKYFSPNKDKTEENVPRNAELVSKRPVAECAPTKTSLTKELDNIAEFFDDDDFFQDLKF